jgi:hypothetical protein
MLGELVQVNLSSLSAINKCEPWGNCILPCIDDPKGLSPITQLLNNRPVECVLKDGLPHQ